VPVKKNTAISNARGRDRGPDKTNVTGKSQAAGKAKTAGRSKGTDTGSGTDRPKATDRVKANDRVKGTGRVKATDRNKVARPRASLKSVVLAALDDMKALEVKVLDVRGLTDIADFMVIASGTSDRHVRSVAQRVVDRTKEAGFRPHGVEGQQDSDWVLIDLSEMIVHVMLPRVREFYGLEKLWDMTVTKRAARA
jgi:ribosome-associated protein